MIKDYKEVWNNCLEIIKDNLQNYQSFKTWFQPIKPVKLENNILTIQVPSHFFYEWLEEHYIDLLKKTIKRILGPSGKLEYSIVMDQGIDSSSAYLSVVPSQNKNNIQNKAKDFPVDINKEKNKDFPNPFIIPGLRKIKIHSQLNENYSFENFIEGDCNRLARSAGLAVAQNPGKTSFNPLYIYSNVGLGKTHLAHAIGIQTKANFPDKTVLYVTAEQFYQQYTDSVRNNNQNDFVHFYQMIDVLIVDDIQFWVTKKGTQEIFFHIFNHLHQKNKQLIICSDKAPAELSGMEQRLISRMKWGLSTDLQLPNVETRIAILQRKLYNEGIEISHDVIEYLAYNIGTNIRELEGVLNSVIIHSSFDKKVITIDLAKQIIDRYIKTSSREITIDLIQKTVCDYFNLPIDSINSKTRKREIVQARQLAMYFSKKMTKASLALIGMQCGRKDHATVLHACRTVKNLSETDKQFSHWIKEIEKKLVQ